MYRRAFTHTGSRAAWDDAIHVSDEFVWYMERIVSVNFFVAIILHESCTSAVGVVLMRPYTPYTYT